MKTKLLKIINHYGINNQQRKLEEEIFELQESITEYEVLTGSKEYIIEELSDVQVLLDQIRYYYQIEWEDINKIMLEKIDRQLERIKNE